MGKALSTNAVFWEVSGQKKLHWQRLSRTLRRALIHGALAPEDFSDRLAPWTSSSETEAPTERSNVVQLAQRRFSGRDVEAENASEKAAPTVAWQTSPEVHAEEQEEEAPVELAAESAGATPRLVVATVLALFVALMAISFAGLSYRNGAQWHSRSAQYQTSLEKSTKQAGQLASNLKADSGKITELQGQLGYTKETNGLAVHVTTLAQTAATSAQSCNQKTQAALSEFQKHGSASTVKRLTSDANKSCAAAQDDYNALQSEVNTLQH